MTSVVTTAGRSRDNAATVLAAQGGTDRSIFLAIVTRNHPSYLGSDPNYTPSCNNPGTYLSPSGLCPRSYPERRFADCDK